MRFYICFDPDFAHYLTEKGVASSKIHVSECPLTEPEIFYGTRSFAQEDSVRMNRLYEEAGEIRKTFGVIETSKDHWEMEPSETILISFKENNKILGISVHQKGLWQAELLLKMVLNF